MDKFNWPLFLIAGIGSVAFIFLMRRSASNASIERLMAQYLEEKNAVVPPVTAGGLEAQVWFPSFKEWLYARTEKAIF